MVFHCATLNSRRFSIFLDLHCVCFDTELDDKMQERLRVKKMFFLPKYETTLLRFRSQLLCGRGKNAVARSFDHIKINAAWKNRKDV